MPSTLAQFFRSAVARYSRKPPPGELRHVPNSSPFALALPGVEHAVRTALTVVRPAAELAAAQQMLGRLTKERDALRRERDTLRTEAATARRSRDVLMARFGLKAEDVDGKSADEVREALARHVTAASAEQVCALGFNLPNMAASGDPCLQLPLAAFQKLSLPEKMQFSAAGGRIVD